MSSRRSTAKRKSTTHVEPTTTKAIKRTSISAFSLKPAILQTRGSGKVFTCGQNDVGQLGFGEDAPPCKTPKIVEGLDDIVDISAGGMHTICFDKNGKVYTWGCNDDFALGRETTSETEAIPGEVELNEKAVQISAGDSHSAVLTATGNVYAWGSFRDSHGVMGLTPEGKQKAPVLVSTNAAKISSGTDHLLILSSNGSVHSLGCAENGQLGRVCTRFNDRNSRRGLAYLLNAGLITHPRSKFDNIWTGSYTSFVRVHSSGDLYTFGLNNHNQLGLSGFDNYAWPELNKSFSPEKKWVSICGGQHHTLALDNKGKTYVLGRKEYGRLGLGKDSDDAAIPTLIPSLADKEIVTISCGDIVSFAVTKEGEAYGWGMGNNLQLGNGSEDDAFEPQLVTGKQLQDYKIIKVSGGGQHTVFIAQSKK